MGTFSRSPAPDNKSLNIHNRSDAFDVGIFADSGLIAEFSLLETPGDKTISVHRIDLMAQPSGLLVLVMLPRNTARSITPDHGTMCYVQCSARFGGWCLALRS